MENPHSILKKVFGYDSFRPGQEEIVSRLLAGQDVLVCSISDYTFISLFSGFGIFIF